MNELELIKMLSQARWEFTAVSDLFKKDNVDYEFGLGTHDNLMVSREDESFLLVQHRNMTTGTIHIYVHCWNIPEYGGEESVTEFRLTKAWC